MLLRTRLVIITTEPLVKQYEWFSIADNDGVIVGMNMNRPIWLQIWTTTYLQRYSTILITFCTNSYLPKLTTLTISDRVVIPFHYMLKLIPEPL